MQRHAIAKEEMAWRAAARDGERQARGHRRGACGQTDGGEEVEGRPAASGLGIWIGLLFLYIQGWVVWDGWWGGRWWGGSVDQAGVDTLSSSVGVLPVLLLLT